jgi:8-oxo-dGTP pyrophosphatase MutT (NUDIX family)
MESRDQGYRASVAAIIINEKKQFFLVQQPDFKENEWDFVKGGMHSNESLEDTLKRELSEELGDSIGYKILRRSIWNVIYEWPKELQLSKGFRGQARVSFWVKYQGGEMKINEGEVSKVTWVDETEIEKVLIESNARSEEVKIFMNDWTNIKTEFSQEFSD